MTTAPLELLAAQLAEFDERTGSGDGPAVGDATVASLKAELDTFVAELRQRPASSEYENESACQKVTAMVQAIGRDPEEANDRTIDRSGETDNTPSATAETPLGMLGIYELMTKLGEGGMGAVYKARHTKLDKIVAIKVLPADRMKDKGAVARFEREMRAVGKLEHPNIVRAMDAGEAGGMHYLVMEYVQGVDLSQLVKGRGPLPIADACELIRQAAVGLDEAHDSHMVHRDIKPSNIMLCVVSKRKPPVVKILDMGLALLSEAHSADVQGLTTTGQMMGTLDYMAPEQGGDSKNVDIRADIYALGASLYKLLCGEAIYHGEKYQTPVQKMMALATHPAPPIQKRRKGVPNELAAVLHRMLEKNPDKRIATPEDVAQALAPFCAGANLAALLNSAGFDVAPTPDTALSKTQPSFSQPDADTGVSAAPAKAKPPVASAEKTNPALAKAPPPKSSPTPARVDKPPVPPMANSAAPMPHIHTHLQTKPTPAKPLAKTSAARKLPPWLPLAIGGGLLSVGAIVALAAMVFFFQTKNGTLRVEINDPSIEVTVKGTGIVLKQADKEEITLSPGEHALVVKRGDFTFDTRNFELKKGETTTVSVELLPGVVQVTSNGRILDRQSLDVPREVVEEARGPQNFALAFDGQASNVRLPIQYDGSHPLTIEAIVQLDAAAVEGTAIVVGDVNQGGVALLHEKSNDSGWGMLCHQEQYIKLYSHRKATNGYVHLAAVWDRNSARLYVNGQLQATAAVDLPLKTSPLSFFVGANPEGTGKSDAEAQGEYFAGIIDEVRISRVARYSEAFSPKQQHEPDADTIALYHFNEGQGDVLKDSAGNNHHGKIVGAKWVRADGSTATGTQSTKLVSALEFDGVDDFVALPDLPYDKIEPITFEAWVTPSVDTKKPSAEPIVWGNGAWTLMHTEKDWRHFRTMMVGSQRNAQLGRRDHVAAVWDGKEPRLYVNGIQGNAGGKLQGPNVHLPRTLGAMGGHNGVGAGRWFHGAIDEVRISKGARYASNFTPAEFFATDADTIALYHFDDGERDVLHDSSGNNHHGKIVGAKWVQVESSAIGLPAGKFALKFERGNTAIAAKVPHLKSVVITYEAWATLEPCSSNPGSAQQIITTPNGHLGVLGDGLTFYTFHGEANVAGVIVPKQRVHIAGVNDGKMRRVYMNGKLIAKTDNAGTLNPEFANVDNYLGPLTIGAANLEAVIDAIRISKTARYDTEFTPPAEFTKDDDTFALYLFNEGQGDTLHDSSGNGYDVKIAGAKWVNATVAEPPSRENFALEFDGKTSLVSIPSLSWDGTPRFTVEAWIASPSYKDGVNIITVNGVSRYQLFRMDDWWAGGMARTGGIDQILFPSDKNFRNRMAHVAYVVDGKTCRLFENGKLITKGDFSTAEYKWNNAGKGATIGGQSKGWFMFRGQVDEVRISSVPRYTEKFTPARRFEPDADTTALYHFDEGEGDVLRDSSGNNHHGKIAGAKWVNVNAVGAAPPAVDLELILLADKTIEIPGLAVEHNEPITLEGFFTAAPRQAKKTASMLGGPWHGICIEPNGHWQFGWTTDAFHAVGWTEVVAGRRTHVAGVRTADELLLFVDGKLSGREQPAAGAQATVQLGLGGDFAGRMDELRISKIARYTKEFTPPALGRRFSPDEHTLALYHCDEGDGEMLRDASGNDRHVAINGAKWTDAGVAATPLHGEIDQLTLMDPAVMTSTKMKWERVDGRLIGTGTTDKSETGWTGFTLPTELTGDYEVEIEFVQRGFFPVQIDLPLTDTALRLDLAGNEVGMMGIDGKSRAQLEPPLVNRQLGLKSNVPQTLVAQVRQRGTLAEVKVTLDGQPLGEFSGERQRISLPHWVKPDVKHVKSASMCDYAKAYWELRRAVVRPLSPDSP